MPLRHAQRAIIGTRPDPRPLTVDNWNDGDVAEWTDNADGTYSAQTTTVKEGTHAGELASTGGTTLTAESLDGLPTYPLRGDTFRAWIRGESGTGDPRLSLHWSYDGTVYYRIRVDFVGDEFLLHKYDGANSVNLASALPTLATATWYEAEVDYQDTITATLYAADGSQVSQISATDTSIADHEGVKLTGEVLGSGDSFGYVDDWRITGAA